MKYSIKKPNGDLTLYYTGYRWSIYSSDKLRYDTEAECEKLISDESENPDWTSASIDTTADPIE